MLKVQLPHNVSYVTLIQQNGEDAPVVVDVMPAPEEETEEPLTEEGTEFGT